ncbi:TonB-dependent receptor [Stenotrophomonas maltophilia]|uniref:TonB-dependent receptor domain-containing protein n=2 Tax=Gammaproteobacteria TaxID=1236 RepID=UPI0002C5375E|nr:TonB-dependent receptor [Stenotrophomonas maltophilia]MBA0396191.1 TonB-dependent receptor [Stenotrophomonas maltophilia]MBN5142867.1 TonB-dependent receptor [Stenotrophomonas maltophilia]PJL00060.1 TonB-dependent receptor [Stenotrophomonas maltophilia]PJL38544.1 TonB-dependent receptor [Stenotrophomonas maltophilia]QGL77677.1 TonB-dependent receptor [Stenotrophomonas maltophilia]
MHRPLFVRSPLSVALGSALLLAAASPAIAQQAAAQEEKANAASGAKTPVQLDRITVTGSRIYRAGFDTLEPAAVVSRESIENYGDTNLIDAVTRIPGVSAGVSSRGDQAGFGAGVNFASKFGLGSNRLLTLVNGRRFVTSTPPTIFGAGGGSGIQVDMNAIPSVMVQRIESLSVGGAPTYGSDAISGVNNIILRDKFDGAEVELGYGRTSKNDNERYSWSAIFGTDFADGRGHIVVAAELDNADGVNALQRDFYRQGYSLQANPTAANARNFQPWRQPGNDGRIDGSIPFNTGPADGIPDQVWIRNRRIASMTFGGLVMPATGSYTRNGLGDILGFGPNKDKLWQFNNEGKLVEFNPGISYAGGNASGGDGLNLFETVPLIADLERRSVFSTGSFDFTDNVRGFFELSRYEATARETLDQNVYNAVSFGNARLDGGGTASGALTFSASNPFLSAETRKILADNGITSFRLSRSSRDLSMNNASTETRLTRAVLGLSGAFNVGQRNFNWEASVTHGRGDFDYLGTGLIQQNFINAINVTTDASGRIICDATRPGTTADANCRPLNLFGENQASREALDYVSTRTVAKAQTRQTVINTSLSGGLFDLPGGELSVAAGFEHRREEGSFTPSEYQRLGQGRSVPTQAAEGKYHTNEVFAEVLAPLFNPDWDLPGLHRLDLTAKFRRVDNSVAGAFNAFTYGIQYEPIAGLQLRGNKTQSLRAPSIAELYTTQQPAYYNIPEVCSLDNISGGSNPAVRRRNCQAFFAAYPGADPNTFRQQPTNTLGSTNGSTRLQNETAKSWTAGIVFAPEWIPGLRVAADWYDIKISNVITSLSANDIITGCFDNADFNAANVPNANRFCGLVTRDPNTGVATDIKTEYGNGPVLMFRGWTAEVGYRWDLSRFGVLDLDFYGYMPKNRGQAANRDVPFVEQAGSFNEPKRQFRWTAQHRIGNWNYGVASNYTSRAQYTMTDTPESRQYFYRDSWTTWDANVTYRITDAARVTLSVINVGDDIGPFPYVLDSLGRRYMASLRYNFK